MAYPTSRYAAHLKKHGRNELDHNSIQKKISPPRKFDSKFDSQHAGPVEVEILTDGRGRPGDEIGNIAIYPLVSRTKTPTPPSVSSAINFKKRAASPDTPVATDLFRPQSPLKVSRKNVARHVPTTTEQHSYRERPADVSRTGKTANDQVGFPTTNPGVGQKDPGSNHRKSSPLRDEGSNSPNLVAPEHPTVLALRDRFIKEVKIRSVNQDTERPETGATPHPSEPSPPLNEYEDEIEYELPVNDHLESQPESRPISQDQLTAEVKAIYAGLVIIEAKCINVVSSQTAAFTQGKDVPQLDSSHWQAMIALHRTLLHEHHDFLLASQHPSASQPLRNLALKYSMPARMWKHGIHNFLELLRRRLPHSLEFMLSFIYMAYQMIALLYETVPSFEETWIECLGDLSRYRMAIEDEDQSDRDTWTGVARYWYGKAADKTPMVGRLYHHLAILARSQALQQLSLYCRSLSAVQIFQSARESIMTLFDPILARPTSTGSRPLSVESWFIRCHALIFTQSPVEAVNSAIAYFLTQLADHISRMESRWKLQGVYIAITNVASLLSYGSTTSYLRDMFVRKPTLTDSTYPSVYEQPHSTMTLPKSLCAWKLLFPTFDLALRHTNRDDALPHIHVMLVFIWKIALLPYSSDCLKNEVPWNSVSKHLNTLCAPDSPYNRIESTRFPSPEKGNRQQLPEDFLIRGLVWSQEYFPNNWFDEITGEDERMVETALTSTTRVERVLWLGVRISASVPQHKSYIQYDTNTKRFFLPGQFESRHPYSSFHERSRSFKEKLSMHPKVRNSFEDLMQ